MIFLSPLGRPQEPFGALWRPPWGYMAPRSALEGSRPSFSTLRGPSGEYFPDALKMLTCLFSCFLLRFLCVFLFVLIFAPVFPSFKVKDIKFENPGSLNPWVAAGGREAIRIFNIYEVASHFCSDRLTHVPKHFGLPMH